MPTNITLPEPIYTRLWNRREPFSQSGFSAVIEEMLDAVEDHPPKTIEPRWETAAGKKTIGIKDDVHDQLWELKLSNGPRAKPSFPELLQWLLNETEEKSATQASETVA